VGRCSKAHGFRLHHAAPGSLVALPAAVPSPNPEVWRARFLRALGTVEQNIAETLIHHVISVLHTDPSKPLDSATANLVLAPASHQTT
jgi:hypothetical protein